MKENTLLLRRNSVQNLFNGYYYDSTIAAIAGAKLSQIAPENQNSANKTDGKFKIFFDFKWNYLDDKKATKNIDTTEVVSQQYKHSVNMNEQS